MALPDLASEDSRVQEVLEDRACRSTDATFKINSWYGEGATSERSVRRYRQSAGCGPGSPIVGTVDGPEVVKGTVEETSEGVTFHGVHLPGVNCVTAHDWTPIFAIYHLDPAEFAIVDDTVKINTWQQSKALEDGTRDVIQMYSHSAKFRRHKKKVITENMRSAWRTSLLEQSVKPVWTTPSDSGTYLILIADPQLGKKGTEEAVANWKRGVANHIRAITEMQARLRGPVAVHVAFMGDETEGVCNNYNNQPWLSELNLTAQLELDFDMRMWTLREVEGLGLPLSASSVISNHGELTRNGSKDVVTTRGDNASTHIARQVAKTFKAVEPYGGAHIEWTIGGDEPHVLIDLAGIPCYFSHGYIEKGKGASVEIRVKTAIERQIIGRTDTLGAIPLWFMAHYHHFHSQEFEGRTLFACPALEAERSSEYMLDQFGVWSPPGMMGMLIGRDKKRGWSDLSIF